MSPSERAARRASWSGEIVSAGTPKGALYASLSPRERIAALADLNRRVFGIVSYAPSARKDWPGEIFEIQGASAHAAEP